MTPDEYRAFDGLGLAAQVRAGAVTPDELLDAALAAVAERNPDLNAIVHLLEDQARAALADGLPDGPFRGVPFPVKDLYAFMAGAPCENGSRSWCGYVAQDDVELIRRYRAAGLILFARTATPEFGLSVSTEPLVGAPTRNPHDRDLIAGGSSGGAAAAVAGGMAPMAHASDGGGSIRIPAACCGLFGLKPTRGRITLGPIVGEAWAGLATNHAVTRTVRDSAALLDASAGPMTGDPYTAPPPSRPYLDEVGADPGRLRVALSLDGPGGVAVDPARRAATEAIAALLSEMGHAVEAVSLPYDADQVREIMTTIVAANTATDLARPNPSTGAAVTESDVEPLTWAFAERGRAIPAAAYIGAVYGLHGLGRAFAALFESVDLWLCPALAAAPPRLGHFDTADPDVDGFVDKVMRFTPYTAIGNISGAPSAVVPAGSDGNGLPTAVQLTGPQGAEDLLFRVSSQIETARPWDTA